MGLTEVFIHFQFYVQKCPIRCRKKGSKSCGPSINVRSRLQQYFDMFKKIPGVGFEPTRTTRPLELKSNALTTRPSWSRAI